MAKKRKKKKPVQTPSPVAAQPKVMVGAQVSRAAVSKGVFGGGLAWDSMLVGLLIFLISTPAIVGPYGQEGGYTPDLHMAAYIQVGAMIILTLFLLSTFFRKHIFVPRSPVLLPLLVFYVWAMLSILWADVKYEAVVDGLDWTGAFLCAFLIILLLRNATTLNALLFFVFIRGLLMALLGIWQWLFGVDWVQQHIVPAATFSNKNMAGQYGVLTFPIAVMFFLRARSVLHIWFFAISAALIAAYIFYTRSRGAWIGFIVEIIILSGLLIYLKRKHGYHFFGDLPVKKIALGVSLVLFLGMSYLTPAMLGNADKVVTASIGSKTPLLKAKSGGQVVKKVANFEGSADTRITMWANSIPMFRDNFLIGVGLGNWTIHYAKYQSWFKPDKSLMQNQYHANAHNDYIEILCELGIIGFALFIWVVVSLFKLFMRLLNDPHEEYFLIATALILAVMGVAVNAVFSFPFKQPVPIFLIMVYIAILSNIYGISIENGREYAWSLPSLPFRVSAMALAALLTTGLFSLQYNWYKSELYYRTAVISLKEHKYSNAYAASKRAYELNPLRTSLLWLKATALLQTNWRANLGDIIRMFNQVEQARPYSSSALLNLAQTYRRAGRMDEALQVVERLASVQPTNAWVRYQHGKYSFIANKREQAKESLVMARDMYARKGETTGILIEEINALLKELEQPQ